MDKHTKLLIKTGMYYVNGVSGIRQNPHLSEEELKYYIAKQDGRKHEYSKSETKSYEQIKQHLERCQKCRNYIDMIDHFYVKEQNKYIHRQRIRRQIVSIAVVLMIAIYAVGPKSLLKPLLIPELPMTSLIKQYQKYKHKYPQSSLMTYAEKYSSVKLPKSFYDDLQQDVDIQETNRANKNIQILTPANLSIHKDSPIHFSWSTKRKEKVQIVIKDNQNNKIWQSSTSGQSLLYKHHLPTGLYYWDLRIKGIIKIKGKFYVVPTE